MNLKSKLQAHFWPLLAGMALLVGWWFAAYYLCGVFSLPSSDGAQYLMPTVVAKHPMDLTLPMVGTFQGFDHTWGLQCIGSLVLTTALKAPWPWSYSAQIAMSLVFVIIIAAAMAWFVRRMTANSWLALAGGALILGNLTFIGIGINERPELWCTPFLMLLVWCLARELEAERPTNISLSLGCVAALILATLHPYAIAFTGGLLFVSVLLQFHLTRQFPGRVLIIAFSYILGLALLISYFSLKPAAFAQFRENIALQSTFNHSRLSFLYHPQQRLGAEWPWWIVGAGAGAWGTIRLATRYFQRGSLAEWMQMFCGLIVAATVFLDFVLRTENFFYTAVAFPFAAAAALGFVESIGRPSSPRLRMALATVVSALLLFYFLWVPVRWSRWRAEGFVHIPKVIDEFVTGLPPARKTYIPHLLWENVLTRELNKFQFFTFPLPLADASRTKYEESFLADTRPGDVLVVDIAALAYNKFRSQPLMPVDPPDPEKWEFVSRNHRMFSGARPWGWDLRVYRRK